MEQNEEALQLIKLSFEYARDLSQHLITLATGAIAVSITFTRDILKDTPTRHTTKWLLRSWNLFLLSIMFGVWSQMAITGSLDHYKTLLEQVTELREKDPTAIHKNVTIPAALQIFSFVAAVFCIVKFGFKSTPMIPHQETTGEIDPSTAKD